MDFDSGITSGAFVFIPGCISFITKIEFNKRFAILQATLYKTGSSRFICDDICYYTYRFFNDSALDIRFNSKRVYHTL